MAKATKVELNAGKKATPKKAADTPAKKAYEPTDMVIKEVAFQKNISYEQAREHLIKTRS